MRPRSSETGVLIEVTGSRESGQRSKSLSEEHALVPSESLPSLRFHYAMAFGSFWIMLGAHLDAWAHSHVLRLENFFTPWHAVLYSGLVFTILVMAGWAYRHWPGAVGWKNAVPAGYRGSAVGAGLSLLGGLSDMTWHLIFGVEQGVDALMAPSHLLLAVGVGLIVAGPLRSAWGRAHELRGFRQLAPALISATMLLALLTLLTQIDHPFVRPWAATSNQPPADDFPLGPLSSIASGGDAALSGEEVAKMLGYVNILLHTAFLMAITLALVARFRLPLGGLTLLFGLSAALIGITRDQYFVIGVALLAGLASDVLVRTLRPTPARRTEYQAFAALAPVILYTAYFGALWQLDGIWWPVPVWTGAIAMSGILGWLLSYPALMWAGASAPIPYARSAENRGPAARRATDRSVGAGTGSVLGRLWSRATDPSSLLVRAEERRRARMLAGLLLVLIPVGLVSATAVPYLTDPTYTFLASPASQIGVTACLLLVLAYVLSRTPYSAWGAIATIAIALVFSWVATVSQGQLSGNYTTLVFLAVPVLLSSMLLELRHTFLTAIAGLVAALIIPVAVPGVTYSTINFAVIFFVMISALVLVFAAIRKKDLLQISDESKKLAEAQQVAHLGSWEWDIRKNQVKWSDELYQIYGAERSSLLTYETFVQYLHPEDREFVNRTVMESYQTHQPFSFDHRIVRPDGAQRWLHGRGQVVVDDKGQPLRMLGTAQDITERRRMEEEREAAREQEKEVQRLKELDEFRTRFINTAAHELNTPMTPIIIELSLLERELAGNLNESQQEDFNVLKRNIERLGQLIQDVLDTARIQASRLRVQTQRVDLSRLVKDSVGSFRAQAQQAHVALESRLAPSLPVDVDPGRITQVVYNLLSNALKFTPDGGRIVVETKALADEAIVRVQDTGQGLTPDQIARLFQPFVQIQNPTHRPRSGTGLGLYICRSIMDLHRGRIWCTSPGPGKGSTFAVGLPLKGAADGTRPVGSERLLVPMATAVAADDQARGGAVPLLRRMEPSTSTK